MFVRRVLVWLHVAIAFGSYLTSIELRRRINVPGHQFLFHERTHLILATSGVSFLWMFYSLFGLYRSNRLRGFVFEARQIVLANLLTFGLLLAFATGLDLPFPNRLQIVFFIGLNTSLALLLQGWLRLVAASARRRGYNFRNLLILGSGPAAIESMVRQVKENDWWGLRIVGIVVEPADSGAGPAADKPDDPRLLAVIPEGVDRLSSENAEEFLDQHPVDECWLEGLPHEEAAAFRLAQAAATRGISVRCLLPHELFSGARWSVESFGGITTLTAARVPIDPFAVAWKRPLDLAFAALVLVLASPVMLLAALLVKLTSEGPVFFRQTRVGLNGRHFTLFKFRTMVVDAEAQLDGLKAKNEMQGPVFKIKRDPRVTPIGRWLRRMSVDELPQLFNVLRSEMSLVGPRPPLPSEVDLYEPTQRRRLSVRPGITGLWQVEGRNEIASFDRWVALDLEYIDRWSLWLDLKILFRTVPAVFLTRGAR